MNSQLVRTPFPGNVIPSNRFDPVALKIQALIPQPTYGALTNNFQQIYSIVRNQRSTETQARPAPGEGNDRLPQPPVPSGTVA